MDQDVKYFDANLYIAVPLCIAVLLCERLEMISAMTDCSADRQLNRVRPCQ